MAIRDIPGNPEELEFEPPFYSPEMALAHTYCVGQGIELGAGAHNPFNLPGSINIAPFSDIPGAVDYNDFLLYRHEQVRRCGHYCAIDLAGEAHALPVGDATQDYIISSHVVEHLPDLIAAFLDWNRVLKPGGIIFTIFPKRDALPTDGLRPITPLAHFIEDYYLKHSSNTHPIDEGQAIRGHYHVFTLGSMLELIHWCNQHLNLSWTIEHVEETDSKVGNGHTVVCRYTPKLPLVVNAPQRTPVAPMSRLRELVDASREIWTTEGPRAFFVRLGRWIGGERRYRRK